jgi:hypothetical protein
VSDAFFDQVRDAFEGFVASLGRDLHTTAHGRGVKAWYGDATREHYEAQLIRTDDRAQLEIGFHAEYPKAKENDEVLARLIAREREWRPALGKEAEAGGFLGRNGWTRISEVWELPQFDAIDDVIDVAARLADYVHAIEPVRR